MGVLSMHVKSGQLGTGPIESHENIHMQKESPWYGIIHGHGHHEGHGNVVLGYTRYWNMSYYNTMPDLFWKAASFCLAVPTK
jgi:hypothetical protein